MSKPRKQTYTLEMYLAKMRDLDIRSDQDVQRLSDQWNNAMANELIISILNGEYVPPVILGQEKNSQMWIIDGLQRSTVLMKFRYGNYKITSSVEEPFISYRAKCIDADGEVQMDGNGDIIWEVKEMDIRHKTYDHLPEELKKCFNEYQIESVIHENYDMQQISKLVRRYNFHKSMNVSQKMFTFVDRYARKIREILKRKFFIECTGYTKAERKNGGLERLILETIMTMFHMDDWKKPSQIGAYINEHSSMQEFEALENLIIRLENIVSDDLYNIFTSRDSGVWFTTFYKFSKLNLDDSKFAEFLAYFKGMAEQTDINGLCGFEKGSSAKDKVVVRQKLDTLESMLYEFLDIPVPEIDSNSMVNNSALLDFVRENVAPHVTGEDISQYLEVLQSLIGKLENPPKQLLEADNKPSLVAMVAYSFEHDVDLDCWFVDFFVRNETYLPDQKENFEFMCNDLKKYIEMKTVA